MAESVRIDPTIQKWIPPLSADEVAKLEASISIEGCRDAIVTWNGAVIDGHHRYAICRRLGQPFQVLTRSFPDQDHAERWVRWNQAGRRNLTDDQRAANAALLERVEATIAKRERAKEAGKTGGRSRAKADSLEATAATKLSSQPKERSRSKVAKAHRVSEKRVRRMRAILDQRPDLHDRILAGNLSLKDAERLMRDKARAEVRTAAAEAAKAVVEHTTDGVHHGRFQEIARVQIPDESVGLVFTDPPYHDKTIGVYSDLGIEAARVLKPGGSLITYTSHHRIPEVISMLQAAGLTFFWPIAMVHNSPPYARMTEYGIVVRWKPLLWFVKGNFRSRDDLRFVDDLVESGKEKGFHPWQQSVVEARYYIEGLTQPGDLVFDPFCGGGTTAVAAKQTNRRWFTCDVDEESVWIARQRLREAVAA